MEASLDTPHAARIVAANATLLAQARLEAIAEFFTADYQVHLTGQTLTGGHGLVRRALQKVHKAVPEVTVEVDVLVEEGDQIAWQRTLKGLHQGRYAGFPASGRELVWREMVVSRFSAGLIAEEWVISDLAEQLLKARKR